MDGWILSKISPPAMCFVFVSRPDLTLALNLGSQDLHDQRFIEALPKALEAAGLPPAPALEAVLNR